MSLCSVGWWSQYSTSLHVAKHVRQCYSILTVIMAMSWYVSIVVCCPQLYIELLFPFPVQSC